MPNDANEIRESLKRCLPWLHRMIGVCSYADENGNRVCLPAIEGAGRTAWQAEFMVENDGDASELRAMLAQCVPWMRIVVDEGYNTGCESENDAVEALAQACEFTALCWWPLGRSDARQGGG